MKGEFDSIIMIGFGGPTRGCCRRYEECPGEAYCYVEGIVGQRSGGPERIREVAAHYEHFGGVSPFTFFSQKQAGALEMALEQEGVGVPVYTGYRFWTPYVEETLAEMGRRGLRRALGVILAPHRTKISWEAYRGAVASAREELGGDAPETEFLETSWHRHPGFIDAIAERVRQASPEGEDGLGETKIIFTAHSIPVSMAKASSYEEEFRETALSWRRNWVQESTRSVSRAVPTFPPALGSGRTWWTLYARPPQVAQRPSCWFPWASYATTWRSCSTWTSRREKPPRKRGFAFTARPRWARTPPSSTCSLN